MKNLKKTILSACIAIGCLTNGNAQENKLKASDGKKGHKKVVLSLGGGTTMPSSDGKDKAFLSNSTAINADLFLPLIRKGWDGGGARDHVKGHKMNFGLNVGGTYNFGGSGGFGTTLNPYAITGQTSSIVSDRGGSPAQAEFRMGAGPQANFYFGKFIVSPMVLGEYFSMTQKEQSVVQTTQYNGQIYDFNLVTLPETKTSGFAVTPKLRLHYMFSDRFGLFADASYTMGPKIETTVSKLIPNGNPSPQSGSYTIQQLETGTMVKGETKSTAYSAMGFNFGVVIGLGKNNHDTSKNTVSSVRRTAGDIKKGWDGKIVDMIVPKTGENNSNIENITVKGSGEFTNNGIPIVYGKTVTGNVKAANGKSNSSIAIKIEQKESNDIANAITDEKGNFSMELAQDTLHGISVNNVEYGKIKILDYPVNSDKVNTDDIRKGWNGQMLHLTDLDRPVNGNEKVTFIEIDKFNIKTGNTFVRNDILLTYKLKKDNDGNIYGIPSVLVGVIIPADDIENLLKSPCSPPCLTVKSAGSCGKWCGNILQPVGKINDFKFDDNKDVTLLCKKQDKIEIYEQLNVNGKKFLISILGTSLQKQTIFESNHCNTYINGFGSITFPHIFTATCEVAGAFIQSLYLDYGIEKEKK